MFCNVLQERNAPDSVRRSLAGGIEVGTMIPAGKVERGERKRTAEEASKFLRRCQNQRLLIHRNSSVGNTDPLAYMRAHSGRLFSSALWAARSQS